MEWKTKGTVAIVFGITLLFAGSIHAQRYMENLGRGVVAVRMDSSQVYVGWRMLGTEWGKDIGYHIYRGTTRITTLPITDSTNYVDATAIDDTYSVSPVIDGVEGIASEPVSVWNNSSDGYKSYLTVPLMRPAGVTTPDGHTCSYSPNDCSVGDLDGDGEYEIVLKWDPDNAKDNASSGYTGNVYLDAYELDGTRLWRIDLGINIRAGAHYTQFIVYDLDSDGKAEVACRTAPYTIDGQGNYVLLPGDTLTDYRETSGYILTGPEYLTIFNGQTGAAMAITNFYPDRVDVTQWGDNYGNRVDRFLAGVAYIDGQRPSLIMARNYYGPKDSSYSSRNEITAWNWRCGTLTQLWWFKAGLRINDDINSDYIGQGCHSLSIADVDSDGKDEIVYGSCVIDDDGSPFYNTALGHGDALHVADLDPDRPGLEVWQCHEGGAGSTFRDAATGAVLFQFTSTGDVGRACADDIYAGNRGGEMWANTSGLRDRYGNYVGRAPGSTNFLVWWDGDLVRELLNGASSTNYIPYIDKYGLSSDTNLLTASGCLTNNGTKATPCLSGDILGDWREEVIVRTSDNTALRIYTTTAFTSTRLYTLMHDCQYREAIAWQNGAYNQPPHPSFYLGDGMASPPTPDIKLAKVPTGDITDDGVVNGADLALFVESWLTTDYAMLPELNLNGDCTLNYPDFAIFAGNWLGF